MTSLIHKLGISPSLAFHDVFDIDDPDLLAFVPRPAHALLLVFPVSAVYERSRREEDADRAEYDGAGPQEEVVWFKQTIRNACGLIGLLHGVANGGARRFIGLRRPLFWNRSALTWGLPPAPSPIEPSSPLSELLQAAVQLSPKERAELLYNSPALESAHQSAAAKGDTAAPQAEDDVDLHYVCFVKSADNRLWELDGRRKGPLDRGMLGEEDDVLSQRALELGVKRFLAREMEGGKGDMRFSLVVLAPNLG